MKGKKISEKELKEQGWEYADSFADSKIFKKGKERILWSPKTQVVTHEFEEDKD